MSDMDDVAQALVADGTDDFTFTLPDGTEKTIKVRPELTWTEVADCAAKASAYRTVTGRDGKPETVMDFNTATFRVECLKLIVQTRPWNTEAVLRKLKASVGTQFDELVPTPFAQAAAADDAPKG